MNSQIFKKDISINLLIELLDKVSENLTTNKNIYIIDNILFKKLQYNNYIQEFINNIREYYYTSKLYYIDRDMSYKNFLTIIRQICNFNNIKIDKTIKYIKNSYEIVYNIII